jgi:hypothetical protein
MEKMHQQPTLTEIARATVCACVRPVPTPSVSIVKRTEHEIWEQARIYVENINSTHMARIAR